MDELKITGEYSVYNKTVFVVINGEMFDLSNKIPEHIWRIGVGDNIYNLNNPVISWRIRKKLSKILNGIVRRMLHKRNVRIVF